MVIDDKDRLSIFDKNGPYLATKKVGKNNPKAEAIKADNEIRMEWNRAVDRAIVSGVSETEVMELKKTEITEKVKESVEQNGNKPELFGEIVRAAILLLECLIIKAIQKVMDRIFSFFRCYLYNISSFFDNFFRYIHYLLYSFYNQTL